MYVLTQKDKLEFALTIRNYKKVIERLTKTCKTHMVFEKFCNDEIFIK
jgi:hypothetical protein